MDLPRIDRTVLPTCAGRSLNDVKVCVVPPGKRIEDGTGVTIRHGIHPGPFGAFLLALTDEGICALSFLRGRGPRAAVEALRKEWPAAKHVEDPKGTKKVADRIFGGPPPAGTPPLNVIVKGTDFRIKVWRALVRIPAGSVVSYEDVAVRVGAPKAVRAVGNAVGRNPVAFLIPCHRVVRKTGALGGYGGGTARKRALLARERAADAAPRESPGIPACGNSTVPFRRVPVRSRLPDPLPNR